MRNQAAIHNRRSFQLSRRGELAIIYRVAYRVRHDIAIVKEDAAL
jgi:hypothetical protein